MLHGGVVASTVASQQEGLMRISGMDNGWIHNINIIHTYIYCIYV